MRSPISRRGLLASAASLLGAAQARPAAAQLPQDKVGYRQPSPFPTERCVACRHYMGDNRCDSVDGYIAPNGWCRLFRRRSL